MEIEDTSSNETFLMRLAPRVDLRHSPTLQRLAVAIGHLPSEKRSAANHAFLHTQGDQYIDLINMHQ